MRITQIMKIIEFHERTNTNHENHEIILDNCNYHQNLKNLRDNYANYKNN